MAFRTLLVGESTNPGSVWWLPLATDGSNSRRRRGAESLLVSYRTLAALGQLELKSHLVAVDGTAGLAQIINRTEHERPTKAAQLCLATTQKQQWPPRSTSTKYGGKRCTPAPRAREVISTTVETPAPRPGKRSKRNSWARWRT